MLQPEMGQDVPFVGSFNHCCEQTRALRVANPFLCERHGLSTDMATIEAEVDFFNATRCIAGGWTQFVILDDPASAGAGYTAPPAQKKNRGAAAMGSVKRVAAGIGVVVDLFGPGAKPVEAGLAEKRAAVCVGCPKNDGGDFLAYFTEPIAEKIRLQLEIKNDMQLRTSHDDKLTVCSACDCPLKLKVHVDLAHILKHTSEEVKARLHPMCWITAEEKA
jgi:hypothetical protein